MEILKKRVEALDKLVVNVSGRGRGKRGKIEMGTGILPKDGHFDVSGDVLENISKFYTYYDEQASLIRTRG